MDFITLVWTLAIILPFFIQFHYLLEDPWKLCRAFHYYSSISKQKIPSEPRLILHYPRIPSCDLTENSVNSLSNTSSTNIRIALSTPACYQLETPESELDDENSLELEPSTSFVETRSEIPMIDIKNEFCKRLSQKYGQSCSNIQAMLNLLKHDSTNPKDISVKSGLTDLIQEKRNPATNAQVEYLYSRDLFLFEYRKRPNVKSEGTQSGNERRARSFRAWK